MICFFWFRTRLTIPADAAGAKAVFRTNIDDYGEVWVNGEMPRAAGPASPGCIQGFNMPNRVVLADQVNPATFLKSRSLRSTVRCRQRPPISCLSARPRSSCSVPLTHWRVRRAGCGFCRDRGTVVIALDPVRT